MKHIAQTAPDLILMEGGGGLGFLGPTRRNDSGGPPSIYIEHVHILLGL